jgi:5-(carboxyamino)imidazole ribonucleotide synthase
LTIKAVLPGAAIGVLGSGQLGRMFAIAARRMGYRVHTFSPDSDTPTGQVSDYEVKADYTDLDAVREFARGVSVLTFEFENVPAETVEAASQHTPVRPSGAVLHTTQHRLREKTFLQRRGFPIAPFRHVASLENLQAALTETGCPAVLKTAGFGYDGKGQTKLLSARDAGAAFAALDGREAVLEAFVDFEREVSVVAARSAEGEFTHYGVIENTHARHILDLSVAPAPGIPTALVREAVEIARSVLEALDVVGVMCVEFFVTRGGRLLINELAPRPHNSGHLTFDACVTSQFEQQLRAVCCLPLGSTELLRPAAMANLLGELWRGGAEPDWPAALAFPDVKLHLYGKLEARTGRKMGHLTALAATAEEAARTVAAARAALGPPVDTSD